MTIRYERKRLMVSADMYFPYMQIDGVENIPEELKDAAGNDVIRVLYGALTATQERLAPGDYVVRYDDGTTRVIPHKEFVENFTKLPVVCPHCGKSESDEIALHESLPTAEGKEQAPPAPPPSDQGNDARYPFSPPKRRR